MYRVNKYVPNCVGNDRIRVENVFSAEDVLYTDAYHDAVGGSHLYWRISSPFNFRTYLNELTCDMLFFNQDDHGQYWGALHVKTDTLMEMHQFLQAASVRVVTANAEPNKPIETTSDIDEKLIMAKMAYLAANPGITDADVVLDHIETDYDGAQLFAQVIPKINPSNIILKVTIDNDKVDSENC